MGAAEHPPAAFINFLLIYNLPFLSSPTTVRCVYALTLIFVSTYGIISLNSNDAQQGVGFSSIINVSFTMSWDTAVIVIGTLLPSTAR